MINLTENNRDQRKEMHDELRALISRHCETLQQEFHDFEKHFQLTGVAENGVLPKMREAMEILHKIKGSSGSIGFLDISQAAADLEAHLRIYAGMPVPYGEKEKNVERSRYQALKKMIEDVSPETSLFHDMELPV